MIMCKVQQLGLCKEVLGRWNLENQEFKAILSHIVNPACAT